VLAQFTHIFTYREKGGTDRRINDTELAATEGPAGTG